MMAELRGRMTERVERLHAVVVRGQKARGPAAVERVEGTPEVDPPLAAVAVDRVAGPELEPAAEHLVVVVAEQRLAAVHAAGAPQRQALAGAEQVDVLQLEAGGVDPALAPEAEPGIDGPDVLSDHHQV